jgi:thiol:disulfide interchange protein DsbA
VGLTAFAWAAQAQTLAAPLQPGKHYTVLSPAQPTSADEGKVEIAEVFMYGCAGCFGFEPHLQRWLASKADYINFVRVPAQWANHRGAPIHARAYYTAEALGKLDEIDAAFFAEIHTNRNPLDTEANIAGLFAKHGVDAATFKSTFNSFAINTKVKRAEELVTRYSVNETPTMIVNGKFVVTGNNADSYENWLAIVKELAAREHAAAATTAR